MNKLLCLFIIYIIFINEIQSQDNIKYWNEGNLTWADFQEKSSDNEVSELFYNFGYSSKKQKFGDTTLSRLSAYCYIDKNLSWIDTVFKDDQYLKYNQVIFNILELFRRNLQYELDRLSSISEVQNKSQMVYSKLNSEIKKYKDETEQGDDLDIIDLWDSRITQELKMASDDRIPAFTDRNFGYGINLGFGSGFFTNSLSNYFSPTINFIVGFDLGYKNSILYLNATLASDKVKNNFLADNYWSSGQRADVAIIDISMGQALINNQNIKFSPFFGLGITEFTSTTQTEPKTDLRFVDYNYLFGLNLDVKLKTTISIIPPEFTSPRVKFETGIRIKLYVAHVNYNMDLEGNSINLTVGINRFCNLIRINK